MFFFTGARIADIGAYAMRDVLEEGIGEHEVALHCTRAMVREIAKTYPQTDIMDSKFTLLRHHKFIHIHKIFKFQPSLAFSIHTTS